jgi:hypothetical protein
MLRDHGGLLFSSCQTFGPSGSPANAQKIDGVQRAPVEVSWEGSLPGISPSARQGRGRISHRCSTTPMAPGPGERLCSRTARCNSSSLARERKSTRSTHASHSATRSSRLTPRCARAKTGRRGSRKPLPAATDLSCLSGGMGCSTVWLPRQKRRWRGIPIRWTAFPSSSFCWATPAPRRCPLFLASSKQCVRTAFPRDPRHYSKLWLPKSRQLPRGYRTNPPRSSYRPPRHCLGSHHRRRVHLPAGPRCRLLGFRIARYPVIQWSTSGNTVSRLSESRYGRQTQWNRI